MLKQKNFIGLYNSAKKAILTTTFFERKNIDGPRSRAVKNPGGITGSWAEAEASDRENSDWEGVILMTCRSTKRRGELRRVVPLKNVQ